VKRRITLRIFYGNDEKHVELAITSQQKLTGVEQMELVKLKKKTKCEGDNNTQTKD